jgi:hypothetical protein
MPTYLFLCGIHAGVPARAADKDGSDVAKAFPPLRMLWTVTFEVEPCIQMMFLQALIKALPVARSRRMWYRFGWRINSCRRIDRG